MQDEYLERVVRTAGKFQHRGETFSKYCVVLDWIGLQVQVEKKDDFYEYEL